MESKTVYTEAEIEIISFESEDVIVTSEPNEGERVGD